MKRRLFGHIRSTGIPSTDYFIISVKTDNTGTSGTTQFTIPTKDIGYNYNITTTEHSLTGQTGSVTLTFAVAGTYDVKISGTFPRIYFNNSGDRLKLLEIKQWGVIAWTNFERSFYGCSNMAITATDAPDLSSVTDMSIAFLETTFNNSINHWDVSNVQLFLATFQSSSYNSSLASWDMSSATSIAQMFESSSFNQDVSGWNISSATTIARFARDNAVFNQPIGAWNTTNVITMTGVLLNADAFRYSLANWDMNQVTSASNFMLNATGLSTANYDATLIAWAGQIPWAFNGTLYMGGSVYTIATSGASRAALIADGVIIIDGGGI